MSASAPSGTGRRERSAAAAARRSEEPACTPSVLAHAAGICAAGGLFGLQGSANPAPTSRKPPIRKVGRMTAARTFARGLFEACHHIARRLSLVLYRWAGSVYRRATRGLGPLLLWPAFAALILMVLVPESGMGHGSGAGQVLLVAGALLAVRWLAQARKRVVIQEFVDYTTKDEQAVKGLGTLLVAELSRLH